jgi:hypothetical protein
MEDKRGGQRKAKRHKAPKNQKNRELVPLVVGSYFIHILTNVAYMQIVRSNNNGRSKTNISFL